MNFRVLASGVRLWRNSKKVLNKSEEIGFRKSLKIDDRIIKRLRYLLTKLPKAMSDSDQHPSIYPPEEVKGMTDLDRGAFTKSVKIPGLKMCKREISTNQKLLKPLQLKVRNLKPIGELSDKDPEKLTHCLILLDPDKIRADKLSSQQLTALKNLKVDVRNPTLFETEFTYENWSVSDIMRAVLPEDAENVTSFSQIGHIAHLNLKPESIPFKTLIGQVLLDKIPSVKTVVNKLNAIDNTYRNFQMELLAGEDNFITQTKEHNCTFELDFSKVYWNSRLATEHHRVVDLIPKGSTVYDVFAGIGPFAVPLAKKKHCMVFANDLNPSSFEYLQKNCTLNKINSERIKTFNKDGREFIMSVVKQDLMKRIEGALKSNGEDMKVSSMSVDRESQQYEHNSESFVIMNLPALAVDFLDAFNSLLQDLPQSWKIPEVVEPVLPNVICYCFCSKTDAEQQLRVRVETAVGQPITAGFNSRIVRNVAPNKEMMCVSFKLWPSLVLCSDSSDNKDLKRAVTGDPHGNSSQPDSKKQKFSS